MENSLNIDAKKNEVVNAALADLAASSNLGREIKSLSRFVPHRFLRPFFRQELKGVKDSKVDGLILSFAIMS